MGHKQKGIVSQSIKEVLDSLVVRHFLLLPYPLKQASKQSDSLVTLEKIGTGNYYWAFPSSAGQARVVKLKELQEDIQKALVLWFLIARARILLCAIL